MLAVDVEKRLGDFTVAARFETESGVTALFGPSGAGKTSLINMIAGLLAPDRGRIMYRGKLLFDAAGKVNVPPHRRQFGYVFQDGRLFPHLTVRRNLEYGRRMYRLKRDPAELEALHTAGVSVLVIELQGALFFGTADRLARIRDRGHSGEGLGQPPFGRGQ